MTEPTAARCEPMPDWKPIAASVTGRQHQLRREPGQDRFFAGRWRDDQAGAGLAVIAAADGAGSAGKSWAGAWAACRSIEREVERLFANAGRNGAILQAEFWSEALIEKLFRTARRDIRTWSRAVNARCEDLATTLSVAVAGSDFARFGQIGDGIMGYSGEDDSGGWKLAIEPDQGEFAGETTFLTAPDWHGRFRYLALDQAPGRLFVATDGIAPILFDSRSGVIHKPFVDPLFQVLAQAPGDKAAADWLARFLASDRVAEACPDDLTLILAARTVRTAVAEVDETGSGR